LSFITNALFIMTVLYLQASATAGNDYYGRRLAFFTFYPMTPNETLYNSFLFNALLINFIDAAVVQIAV